MNITFSVIKDNEQAEYCGNISITPHNSELVCKYHLTNQTQSDKFFSGEFTDNFENLSQVINKLEAIVNLN